MDVGKVLCVLIAFSFALGCPEIRAQDSKPVKLLNNFGSIPFEDGRTIVAGIGFNGLTALAESDLLKILRENRALVKSGDEFSGAAVVKAVKVIREALKNAGYNDAEVTAFGEKVANGEMRIEFVVKENSRARVAEILFEGNAKVSSEELTTNFKECIADGWEIYDARKYDYMAAKCTRQLLFERGFFQAKVGSPRPRAAGGAYVVTIEIREGARFRYGEIKIDGARALTKKEILEASGIKTGEVADSRALQDFVYEKLKRLYADKGYILYNAEFEPAFVEPAADGLDGVVDLAITIDEGELFELSKIEFIGVDKAEADKLRELIGLNDGEIYNQSRIEEGIKKINEMKKFYPFELQSNAVEIRPSPAVDPEEFQRVDGSALVRRKEVDETRPAKNAAGVELFIKLRKIE